MHALTLRCHTQIDRNAMRPPFCVWSIASMLLILTPLFVPSSSASIINLAEFAREIEQAEDTRPVHLDLPNVGEFELNLKRFTRIQSGWTCSGPIGADLRDYFVFARRGRLIRGMIVNHGKTIAIRPAPCRSEGPCATVDVSLATRGFDCRLIPPSAILSTAPTPGGVGMTPTASSQRMRESAGRGTQGCVPCGDDGSDVDVLVVYTSNALGFLPDSAGQLEMEIEVEMGFEFANMVLANSQAAVRLRLVAVAPVEYDESIPLDPCEECVGTLCVQCTNGDCSESIDCPENDPCSCEIEDSSDGRRLAMSRLAGMSDGYMDEVHVLRDLHKADTVHLLVNSPDIGGGAGWGGTANKDIPNVRNPDFAFSLQGMSANSIGTGIAHEIGHNLGLRHAKVLLPPESVASPEFSFGHAHVFTTLSGQVRDTMGNAEGTITTIPYYSNPDLLYEGVPIGVPLETPDAAHSVLALDLNRYAVANHRNGDQPFDCDDDGQADADQIASSPVLDQNGNGILDVCERRIYVDASAAEAGEGFTWNEPRRDLRSAVHSAAIPCSLITELWVANGTYSPAQGTDDRNRHFLIDRRTSDLKILGGFAGGEVNAAQRDPAANPTVLSGEIGDLDSIEDNLNGIFVIMDSRCVLIDGFTIERGYRVSKGGAAWISNAEVSFRNVVFMNNSASDRGGALNLQDDSILTIEQCRFESNAAPGGGAISVDAGDMMSSDSTYADNSADFGGAIMLSSNSIFQGTGDVFSGNFATTHGGAIRAILGSSTLARDAVFFQNSSGSAGGAIYADDANIMSLDTNYTQNKATNGGAISLSSSSTFESTGDTYSLNDASVNGGAIRSSSGSSITVRDATLSENMSETLGGAIYAVDSDFTSLDSAYIDNESAYGGAISLLSSSTLDSSGDSYLRNHATIRGGAIRADSDSSISAQDSVFCENSADSQGGAVALDKTSTNNPTNGKFESVEFRNNMADRGGAVWVKQGSDVALVNTIVANNSATFGGGMEAHGDASVLNSLFTLNIAEERGGAIYHSSALEIRNSILHGDLPTEIDTAQSAPKSVSFSNVQCESLDSVSGNINAPPLFVDPVAGDFHLQSGSPCIDAGNNEADGLSGITEDLDGLSRFIDDAATPDCPQAPGECGTAPIVDMGPYEFCLRHGDMNSDDDVNGGDISGFINVYVGLDMTPAQIIRADFDGDGAFSPVDLSLFVSAMLRGNACQ